MRICFLDCFRRLRILTIHQFLSLELVRPILSLVGGGGGGGGGGDVVEAFDRVFRLWFGPSVQVLFIYLPPVLPLLDDLLAIEEHASIHDAGRCPVSFLPVVESQRIAHVLRQRTVQLAFELVDVILCAAFA
jgi:hypothetical protein